MLKDLLYGCRTMARNRGVTAIAVLTLALGIGANTAMFSVINAVLLRPLPYKDSGRLVTILAEIPGMNIFGAYVEYNTFGEWWRARSRSFESMAAYTGVSANLTSAGQPQRVDMLRVSASYLRVIGARPALGRDFLPAEDQPGASRVAILSDRMWKERFGATRAVLGRSIVLDKNIYTVIGVMPPDFDLTPEVLTPIAQSTARVQDEPTVGTYARLKPGVTVEAAQAEIDGLCHGWLEQYNYPKGWGAHVWPIREFMVRGVRSSVVVLAVAVSLVLLIACSNVANLLLARAGARQREIAIRSTLGAGAGRIVRQLLTESALLGMLGGALGLLLAWGGIRVLNAVPVHLPSVRTISIDAPVLCFTFGTALLTTILFGLAPALAAACTGLADKLKEGGRGGEGVRQSRFRAALVVAEVALALLLVIAATLTIRSLARLQAVNPGLNPQGVITASLTLPSSTYAEPNRRVVFFKALLERLRAIPGVKGAGMVSHLPFSGSKGGPDINVEGAPPPRPGDQLISFARTVDPDYFQALQVPLRQGRFFTAHDPSGGLPVAIVNESMARRCWPNQDSVGKRFRTGRGPWITVVGVIGDMRQTSLAENPDLEFYVPHAQTSAPAMALVVRSTTDPMRLAPALRAAVSELDKDMPVSDIAALAESISSSTSTRRFSTVLLGIFAVMALVLAAVGIYGVISYSVMRRTREIGIRIALGAERGRITIMVVGRAVLLGGIGVTIGAAGGLAATRLLSSMLYDVSATDPAVFAGASLFLLAVAALAGYVPARRAAGVDPIVALRCE